MQVWVLSINLFLSSLAFADTVQFKLGKISFSVPVSVEALTINGHVNSMRGSADFDASSKTFRNIKLSIPAAFMTTENGTRDRYMKKLVFQKSDGSMPHIRFEAAEAKCSGNLPKLNCPIQGVFTMRGISKPIKLMASTQASERSNEVQMSGKASVNLDSYEVPEITKHNVTIGRAISFQFNLRTIFQQPRVLSNK